jgi:hypothetical protein
MLKFIHMTFIEPYSTHGHSKMMELALNSHRRGHAGLDDGHGMERFHVHYLRV